MKREPVKKVNIFFGEKVIVKFPSSKSEVGKGELGALFVNTGNQFSLYTGCSTQRVRAGSRLSYPGSTLSTKIMPLKEVFEWSSPPAVSSQCSTHK